MGPYGRRLHAPSIHLCIDQLVGEKHRGALRTWGFGRTRARAVRRVRPRQVAASPR